MGELNNVKIIKLGPKDLIVLRDYKHETLPELDPRGVLTEADGEMLRKPLIMLAKEIRDT